MSGFYQGSIIPFTMTALQNPPITTSAADCKCTFINRFQLSPSQQFELSQFVQDNLTSVNSLVVAFNQMEWLNGTIIQPFYTDIALDATSGVMTVKLKTFSSGLPNSGGCTTPVDTEYTFTFSNVNTNKTSDTQTITFLKWTDNYNTDPSCNPEYITGQVTLQLPTDFNIIKELVPITIAGKTTLVPTNEDRRTLPLCQTTIDNSAGSNKYAVYSSTIFVQLVSNTLKKKDGTTNETSVQPFFTSTDSINGDFYTRNVDYGRPSYRCGNVLSLINKNVNANTIGVIPLELKALNDTFSRNNIPMIAGSFPTNTTVNNNLNYINNQQVIQIYESADSRKFPRYLTYRDRGKFNTPYMTCETYLGEPCNDPLTYWTIYRIKDGVPDTTSKDPITTTDTVAFQSLGPIPDNPGFYCSFMSCQKQGGRAPSMEGKTTAGICEQWSLVGATDGGPDNKVIAERTQFRIRSSPNKKICTNPNEDLTAPCLVVLEIEDVCLDNNKGADPGSKLWSFKIVQMTAEIDARKCTKS